MIIREDKVYPTYKDNEIVKYIGKGFIGFDPENPNMTVKSFVGGYTRSYLVIYKDIEMIVRGYEIGKLGGKEVG
jgi:hypothetical protein